jgi:hypothetical protein
MDDWTGLEAGGTPALLYAKTLPGLISSSSDVGATLARSFRSARMPIIAEFKDDFEGVCGFDSAGIKV